MAVRDRAELGLPDRRVHHRDQAELLGQGPVPVVGAVDHPVPVDRPVEGQPGALDVRVLREVAHHRGALGRLVLRNAGHHAEPVRVRLARLERVVGAVALPGQREDQRAVDPGLVHQGHAFLIGEGRLAVPVQPHALPGALDPGTVGGLFFPDVHLGVNDEHRGNYLSLSSGSLSSATMCSAMAIDAVAAGDGAWDRGDRPHLADPEVVDQPAVGVDRLRPHPRGRAGHVARRQPGQVRPASAR